MQMSLWALDITSDFESRLISEVQGSSVHSAKFHNLFSHIFDLLIFRDGACKDGPLKHEISIFERGICALLLDVLIIVVFVLQIEVEVIGNVVRCGRSKRLCRTNKNSARTVARRLLGASQVLLCQNLSDRQSVKGTCDPYGC